MNTNTITVTNKYQNLFQELIFTNHYSVPLIENTNGYSYNNINSNSISNIHKYIESISTGVVKNNKDDKKNSNKSMKTMKTKSSSSYSNSNSIKTLINWRERIKNKNDSSKDKNKTNLIDKSGTIGKIGTNTNPNTNPNTKPPNTNPHPTAIGWRHKKLTTSNPSTTPIITPNTPLSLQSQSHVSNINTNTINEESNTNNMPNVYTNKNCIGCVGWRTKYKNKTGTR